MCALICILFILHVISAAATITDPTTRIITTVTTAPTTGPGPLPERPPPPVAGGSWYDIASSDVLGESAAAELCLAMGTAHMQQ